MEECEMISQELIDSLGVACMQVSEVEVGDRLYTSTYAPRGHKVIRICNFELELLGSIPGECPQCEVDLFLERLDDIKHEFEKLEVRFAEMLG
jgi:hypothetical protein